MRFLDKLNTPVAFVFVLVVFLAMNGLLLYRYQADLAAHDTSPSAPAEQSAALDEATTAETTDAESTAAEPDPPERPTLQQALQECEAEEEGECAFQFASERAPQAQYVDERSLTDDSGRERNVLYFSDPSRDVCEFRRFEGASGEAAPVYVVIIAGEGSFDDQYAEGEAGCLPES